MKTPPILITPLSFKLFPTPFSYCMIGRGVITPLFYEDPSILPTFFFKFCLSPSFPLPCYLQPPTPTALSSTEWVIVPYLMCYFTWWYSGSTHVEPWYLVPEGSWCVFYATTYQVYWGLSHNVVFCWYFNLISHTHKHTHTERYTAHSGASRHTHPCKYIFTPPVMCSQQLSLLHWMHNSLISKNCFPGCLFFSKIIHL